MSKDTIVAGSHPMMLPNPLLINATQTLQISMQISKKQSRDLMEACERAKLREAVGKQARMQSIAHRKWSCQRQLRRMYPKTGAHLRRLRLAARPSLWAQVAIKTSLLLTLLRHPSFLFL